MTAPTLDGRTATQPQPEMTVAQVRAERVVLSHLFLDLPHMSDAELFDVAAEHAYETGHHPQRARKLIDAEFARREAVRRAELVASMAPTVTYTATGGAR